MSASLIVSGISDPQDHWKLYNEEVPLEQRDKLQVEFVLSRNTFTVLYRRPEASEGGEDERQATRGGARELFCW